MQVILEHDFIKSAKKLPKNIKVQLVRLVKVLAADPFHPRLHTKRLQGDLTGFLSFRVTRDWRVIFYFKTPEIIHLVETSHRKDAYR